MRWLVVLLAMASCAETRDRGSPCGDCAPRIHPDGIIDPTSDAFHGKELERRGWDFKLCQGCHGNDFAGRATAPSCLRCHNKGPTACDTCHAAVPATGAHIAHVITQRYSCNECHRVPTSWDTPGHILDANGAVDPAPAEVTFGALANHDTTPPRRTTAAAFDPATRTCTAVYCHGGVLGDSTAQNITPAWNAGPSAGACGNCHGVPPASHAQTDCAVCHVQSSHIDGTVQVGSTCTSCHGSGTQPAPPNGLHGEKFTTELAVGAHRAHLEGTHGIRGPIACNECHLVPTAVGDPGHIDTPLPAEVFPIGSGTLARTNGANPTWDRTTATCTTVYCHGGGTNLSGDSSPGVRAPVWTAPQQIYCGSCHGIPPADSFHASTLRLTDCAGCHRSVDSFGNIVLTGSPGAQTSEHMNGVIDFQ